MKNRYIIFIIHIILLSVLFIGCNHREIQYHDFNKNGEIDDFENPGISDDVRVADWLTRLTLEDKINLVVGMRANLVKMPKEKRFYKVPGAAGSTWSVPLLGIPSMVLADGPAGLRISSTRDSTDNTFYCTAFPIATSLASTWDVKLVENVGRAIGNEVKEYGVDILLAPAMNIQRIPLAGRNFEYYSEDPLLSGYIGAAMVKGVQSNGVGTAIKHFVANNTETNRANLNTIIDERTLREIYLRGFEIAVREADPWAVMSAYNKINGQYSSESHDLLTKILRDEWGFKGFVMTDWLAGMDDIAQLKAGNDLLMPGIPEQLDIINQGIENGRLDEAMLDLNVKRILKTVLKSPVYHNYQYSNKPALEANALLARQAASEGIVLLKNEENLLPINQETGVIATYGIGSYDFISGGTGSGDVNEAYIISLVEGLENAGIQLDLELKEKYQNYIKSAKALMPEKKAYMPSKRIKELSISQINLDDKVNESAMALITIGRSSGEFVDRALIDDFYLSKVERELITAVAEAYHAVGKKVVVVLNIGSVIEISSWRDDVDAIVLAWQGGQEAGNALSDVLLGKVNPSGKLPTTFPVDFVDVPGSNSFPGHEIAGGSTFEKGPLFAKESEISYHEGVMVGYRFYTTTNKKVAYPFGFGMSYTRFSYSNLELSSDIFDKNLTVKVTIANIGTVAGKEVVQLYLSAPGKSMFKPVFELKGFAKTKLLYPGETQTMVFSIDAKALSSFDITRSAWVAEPGVYKVNIGSSSTDILVSGNFNLASEQIVEKTNRVFN